MADSHLLNAVHLVIRRWRADPAFGDKAAAEEVSELITRAQFTMPTDRWKACDTCGEVRTYPCPEHSPALAEA